MIAFSGVRSSWLMLARKSLFARVAASACCWVRRSWSTSALSCAAFCRSARCRGGDPARRDARRPRQPSRRARDVENSPARTSRARRPDCESTSVDTGEFDETLALRQSTRQSAGSARRRRVEHGRARRGDRADGVQADTITRPWRPSSASPAPPPPVVPASVRRRASRSARSRRRGPTSASAQLEHDSQSVRA